MHVGQLLGRPARTAVTIMAAVGLTLAGGGIAGAASAGHGGTQPPPVKHVWYIDLENEGYAQSFGDPAADPYLATTLRSEGALLKNYYAVGHDSLDNYVAQVTGQAPDTATDNDCGVWTKFTPGVKFEARLSNAILHEMWEKWVFIATAASINCLMRAMVGDIMAAGGKDITLALLAECDGIAKAHGFPSTEASTKRAVSILTTPGSPFAASMLRDVEHGAPIEADHVVGDLIARGQAKNCKTPLLQISYTHLKAYEARRAREAMTAKAA